MSSEVKYDTLPFIDATGKDCFEAGGENVEPTYGNVELKSESVDHIELDHAKSFSTFKDKYLDSSKIDFSDTILSSKKGGYESKSIYEIIGGQVTKETPQQKYQRLQLELQELVDEVELVKKAAKSDEKDASPLPLIHQVKTLQKELTDLHIEKVLGPEISSRGAGESKAWSKQVVNQLETYKAMPSKKEGEKQDSVVYEMYYKPEYARFAQAAKISELEAKLKDMETFVGNNDKKSQSILADPNSISATLMDATASMQAKLSLFDITHVDIIAARLQGLLHAVNEISQKKEKIENSDNQSKINELHELITSWDSVATVVPDLIERLKALHSLNDQATTFSQSLEHLKGTQTEVRDQLRTQKDMLEKFEKSFEENIQSIQSNCSALETRIGNVMKKVGT